MSNKRPQKSTQVSIKVLDATTEETVEVPVIVTGDETATLDTVPTEIPEIEDSIEDEIVDTEPTSSEVPSIDDVPSSETPEVPSEGPSDDKPGVLADDPTADESEVESHDDQLLRSSFIVSIWNGQVRQYYGYKTGAEIVAAAQDGTSSKRIDVPTEAIRTRISAELAIIGCEEAAKCILVSK